MPARQRLPQERGVDREDVPVRRAPWFQRRPQRPADDPVARQQGVAFLLGGALQKVHGQAPHTPPVDGVAHGGRRGQRAGGADGVGGEHAPIDGLERNPVGGGLVPLEQQVGICEEVGVARGQAGVLAHAGLEGAPRLLRRQIAARDDVDQPLARRRQQQPLLPEARAEAVCLRLGEGRRVVREPVDERHGVEYLPVGRPGPDDLVGEQRPVLQSEGGQRGAQPRVHAPRFPKAAEFPVDPVELARDREARVLRSRLQGLRDAEQRSDRAVVGQVFGTEGVGAEVVVRREGDARFHRQPGIAFGGRQDLGVRHQEAVRLVRPDGVAHVALPQRALQRSGPVVGVVRRRADPFHPADAEDHPPRVVRQRRPLGVEETEGPLRLQGAEEGVEHDELVAAVLHPTAVEQQRRLARGIVAELERFGLADRTLLAVAFHLLAEHPAERDAGRGVGIETQPRFAEVAVGVGVAQLVRVVLQQREIAVGHEPGALVHAGRQIRDPEFFERLPGERILVGAPALSDPRQDQASRVRRWRGAHPAGPPGVVPRGADRDVLLRQLARALDQGCFPYPGKVV